MFRILVVDDEESNLQAIQRIFFDETDYELKYSDNGHDTMRLVNEFVPDVILLDINMPEMNGYEVCQKIKSNAETSRIMVMFLSGNIQLSDRMEGYKVLGDDYITKPYNPEELLARVRILIRLKRAQDELRETNYNLEKIVAQRTRQLVLKERQAVVGRMVQGIVHNFRNPLTVAIGFSRFVEKKVKCLQVYSTKWPAEQQEMAKEVNGNIKFLLEALAKIEGLVDSLLVKSRKEATAKYQRLNLNDLITSEINFLEADSKFKHKVIKEFYLDPHLPEFFGSYADFSQLCANMINNAVEAMVQSSIKKITIRTKHDSENIYIDFKDTGHGISLSLMDQIFEPFFTTKALKGDEAEGESIGTGLGLYSCQQLMQAYNGTITVSSELNVGTTFTVTIPYTVNQKVVGDG